MKNELSDRYFGLAEQLQNISHSGDGIWAEGERCFKLFTSLSESWNSANYIEYARIIKLICFRVSFDKEKALYLEERELFREIRSLNNTVWLGY